MTILIKSFYRPYLLERCLKSIYEKVKNAEELEIIILDDGTPEKYISKIKSLYPKVTFKYSQYRDEKIIKIQEHLDNKKRYHDTRIPTELWYDSILNSSEILILTEDDVWFIDNFDMAFYAKEMQNRNIHLLKLGRDINKDTDIIPYHQLTDTISYHNPDYIVKSKTFYNLLLNNSFNLRSLLQKCNVLPKRWIMQLWVMYDIPMGMYRKDYLQFLWKDKFSRVIEYLQLKNAIEWSFNKKGNNKYTLLNKKAMATSYCSSASFNAFNIKEHFDLIKFNFILNELWYTDNFNSYENYPEDYSINYIYNILVKHENIEFAEKWKKWTDGFIEMHKES